MNDTIIHFWENIATTSLGIIITMVGFWVTVGKNMVTRSEVLNMIETQSPYNADRQFIMERLANNKEMQRIQIRLNKYNYKYDWWKIKRDDHLIKS